MFSTEEKVRLQTSIVSFDLQSHAASMWALASKNSVNLEANSCSGCICARTFATEARNFSIEPRCSASMSTCEARSCRSA